MGRGHLSFVSCWPTAAENYSEVAPELSISWRLTHSGLESWWTCPRITPSCLKKRNPMSSARSLSWSARVAITKCHRLWLRNKPRSLLTVLGPGRPRSRCHHVQFLLSSQTQTSLSILLCACVSCVSLCVQIFSHKDISVPPWLCVPSTTGLTLVCTQSSRM